MSTIVYLILKASLFLQRGLIWHLISYQRVVNSGGKDVVETDVHVGIMKGGTPDSNAVVALILSSLEEYKKTKPSVTEVWIKTDNAANYHW